MGKIEANLPVPAHKFAEQIMKIFGLENISVIEIKFDFRYNTVKAIVQQDIGNRDVYKVLEMLQDGSWKERK